MLRTPFEPTRPDHHHIKGRACATSLPIAENARKNEDAAPRTSCPGDAADLATERWPSRVLLRLTSGAAATNFSAIFCKSLFDSRGIGMRERSILKGVLALVFVAATSTLAVAQGSFFSTLSGTVADSSGAVI